MNESQISANLAAIRSTIERRCQANGADPSRITILGVTKLFPAEIANMAVRAGLENLGENRVQEAAGKIPLVVSRPRWHLIGHLQKNKAKKAVELFDIIESVDSVELAELISRYSIEQHRTMPILLEVNSSGETTKHGFDPADIEGSADKINELPGLSLEGLMTLGPLTEDQDLIKRSFGLTKGLYDRMKSSIGDQIRVLSMGMSGDFELALDFGSNEIRIGSALFGPRPER